MHVDGSDDGLFVETHAFEAVWFDENSPTPLTKVELFRTGLVVSFPPLHDICSGITAKTDD